MEKELLEDIKKLGYSLKDISKQTKISLEYLQKADKGEEVYEIYNTLLGFWCAAWLKKYFPNYASKMQQEFFNKRSVAHG